MIDEQGKQLDKTIEVTEKAQDDIEGTNKHLDAAVSMLSSYCCGLNKQQIIGLFSSVFLIQIIILIFMF